MIHPQNDPRDAYTLRNIIGFGAVEFSWGMGLPVLIDSTFLQIFLRNLGAGSFIIGFIPALFFLGPALLGPVSGYLTAHLEKKRIPVLFYHLLASVIWIAFGFYYLAVGNRGSTIAVFLGTYALFTVALGLMLPAWQNYLGRAFSPTGAVSSIAVIMTLQTAAKIIGSFFILKIVERYSFDPRASAYIFLITGIVFTGGSLFFLITREIITSQAASAARGRFSVHLRRSFGEVLRNRNFLLYLGGNIEFFAIIAVLSFYANYAVEYRHVSPAAAAGLFVMMNYSMQFCMNILFGWKGFLSLKHKCVTSHIFSLCGVVLLCLRPALPGFLVASALLGSSRAMRNLVYIPAVRRIAKKDDATDYFAAAPILTLPVSASFSLLSGKILDLLAPLGEGSYRIFFCAAALLIVVSLLCILKTDFREDAAC